MACLDKFISGIQDGYLLNNVNFELLQHNKAGNVVTVKYKGVNVIVDNGYLQWPCIVPPFSVANNIDEMCWSKLLENMQNDVECTFGILKVRWHLLKTGIRVQGVDAVDNSA